MLMVPEEYYYYADLPILYSVGVKKGITESKVLLSGQAGENEDSL